MAAQPVAPIRNESCSRSDHSVDGRLARRWAITPNEEPNQEEINFLIRTGNATETVLGRTAAIVQAKELSAKTWRPIGLESEDGRVKMQFQRGSLQTYRFDTGERR